jgi:hypothetical protein
LTVWLFHSHRKPYLDHQLRDNLLGSNVRIYQDSCS